MSCTEIKKLLKSSNSSCFKASHVAKEKGKEFRIKNKAKVKICRIAVDGCLISDETSRKCDYAFHLETGDIFLVELKGVDVIRAVDQIKSTYLYFKKLIENQASDYSGFIVSSSVPRATNQNFRKLQVKMLKEHGLKITKKNIRDFVSVE